MVRKTLRKFWREVSTYKLLSFSVICVIAAGTTTLLHHHTIANGILAAVAVIAMYPLIARVWQDFRNGTYGTDVLGIVALVLSLALHQFWTAATIVILIAGSDVLERIGFSWAQTELWDLLKHTPKLAHVSRKGKVAAVDARTIMERDKLIIEPGEIVPVDAVILEGNSSFNESRVTGERSPQSKKVGDQILGGSINLGVTVTAQATHSLESSQYRKIIRMLRTAADSPAPFIRLADRYSILFVVAVLAIAGVAWVLSGQLIRFLEVIVVATASPLVLGPPIAFIAGINRVSRDGIIIKTGSALQLLAHTKTLAFDKAGTITNGTPDVDEVVAVSPFARQDVMAYAAALEQDSNHALAQAIVHVASAQKLKLPKTKHVHEVVGLGLEAHVKGQEIVVGRLSLLRERNVSVPDALIQGRIAQTATYVAIGGRLAGYITFKDSLRPHAKPILEALRRLGVKQTLMITGDNQLAAKAIGTQLHISRVIADTLPGEKLRIVEATAEKPVAFVGDGVKDAPILTTANIGIALGARGSVAAGESADIVIMRDDLAYVVRAIGSARRLFRIANETIVACLGLDLVLIAVFATGHFPPIIGVAAQGALNVLVVLSAMQAHRPASVKISR